MRRNKDVKETTRRLIKAGIAVGILGGGAATHMDAWAEEVVDTEKTTVIEEEPKSESEFTDTDTDKENDTIKTDTTEEENVVAEDVQAVQDRLNGVEDNKEQPGVVAAVSEAFESVDKALEDTADLVNLADGSRAAKGTADGTPGDTIDAVKDELKDITEVGKDEDGKLSVDPVDTTDIFGEKDENGEYVNKGDIQEIQDSVNAIIEGRDSKKEGSGSLAELSDKADGIVENAENKVSAVEQAIATAKSKIENATTVEELDEAYNAAKELFDKTKSELATSEKDLADTLEAYNTKLDELKDAKKAAFDAAVDVNKELKDLYQKYDLEGNEDASNVDFEDATETDDADEPVVTDDNEETTEETEVVTSDDDLEKDQIRTEFGKLEDLEKAVEEAQGQFAENFGKIAKIEDYIRNRLGDDDKSTKVGFYSNFAEKTKDGKTTLSYKNQVVGEKKAIYDIDEANEEPIGYERVCKIYDTTEGQEVDIYKNIDDSVLENPYAKNTEVTYAYLLLEIMRSFVATEVLDGATLQSVEWHGFDLNGLRYFENGTKEDTTGGNSLNYYKVTFDVKNGTPVTKYYNYKTAKNNSTNEYEGLVIFEKAEEDFGYVSFETVTDKNGSVHRVMTASKEETDYKYAKNEDYYTGSIVLLTNATEKDEEGNINYKYTTDKKSTSTFVDRKTGDVKVSDDSKVYNGLKISTYYNEGLTKYADDLNLIRAAQERVLAAQEEVVKLEEAIKAIQFEEKTTEFNNLKTRLDAALKDLDKAEDDLKELKDEKDQKVYDLIYDPSSEGDGEGDGIGDTLSAIATETAEEGGSVLGANREQTKIEPVQEEGKVLGAERGRSPKTGDASNVLGAVATMGSSLIGAGAVLGLRRRNK